jgi:hypothetical protein
MKEENEERLLLAGEGGLSMEELDSLMAGILLMD